MHVDKLDIEGELAHMRLVLQRALNLDTSVPLEAFSAILDAAEAAAREAMRKKYLTQA